MANTNVNRGAEVSYERSRDEGGLDYGKVLGGPGVQERPTQQEPAAPAAPAADIVEGALADSSIGQRAQAPNQEEQDRDERPREEAPQTTRESSDQVARQAAKAAVPTTNSGMRTSATAPQVGADGRVSTTMPGSGMPRSSERQGTTPQDIVDMVSASSPAMQAMSMSTQAANVPNVPTDMSLTPSLSTGRIRTAMADEAYAGPENAAARAVGENMLQVPGVQENSNPVTSGNGAIEGSSQAVESMTAEEESLKERKEVRERNDARDVIRDLGETESAVPMNVLSRANRRFKQSKEFIQDKIINRLKDKGRVGKSAFQDTIFSSRNVMPDCVSIGSDNLIESLRDPGSSILPLVNNATGENLTVEQCLNDISLLVDAINSSYIEVVFSKQPVNTKGSVQVRTLRAHYGRGIGLHPTQTKAYNADFDGDTGNLNTDQSNLKNHSHAMTMLIDAEGNPSIDPDFFPLDGLAMTSSKDRSDLLKSMQERNFAWDPSVAERIVDAYIAACNEGDWVKLLKTIDSVAGDKELQAKHGLWRHALSSRILKNIYDYAIDRRGLNLSAEWGNVIDSYEYTDPGPNAHFMTIPLIDMVNEIAHGRPAPNFQDFTAFFNKQYGDLSGKSIGGKNVPFRLLADFAKAIHRTDLVTVGDPTFGIDKRGTKADVNLGSKADNTVTMYDLWQFTCSAGVSKLISGRMHMGSHELASKTQVKSIVLRQLARKYDGSPIPRWVVDDKQGNERLFREWMNEFKNAYNAQMRMWNVSQVKFRGGMGIERGNTGKYDGFEDFKDPEFAKAFVDVFGDYSMERVFPDSILDYGKDRAEGRENTNAGIIRRYRSMSVTDFAIHNRLDWYSEGFDSETGKSKNKLEEVNKRLGNGTFKPMDVIMVVSDRRSKQFGDYEKSWIEATAKHVDILNQIKDDAERSDFDAYAYDMLEFIHLMSPRMFDHFHMDSPITFIKSKWGQEMLKANTADRLRSVLVSMTIEYRLSKASNLLKSMDELMDEGVHDEKYNQRMEATEVHYMNELRNLASSSMAWESIVSEMLGETDAFHILIRDKKIESNKKTFVLKAQDFWNNANPDDYKNMSIGEFLKSDESYNVKMSVLCDIIKFNTGINAIDVKHVIGMLAHNPDPLFAGSRFEMDTGIRSAVRSVKDSIDKISSYKSKTPSKIMKRANKIIADAYENKQAFEQKLFKLANDPGYYCYVDSVLAADAISSIYEKDYSDSEKIKQQTLVNGYFEAVSLQRSGGFYTHLQQTDNSVVNTIGFDQLTNFDIVRILGDPSIELHGYDEFGVPCTFSRRSLCGGNSIDDVLTYLEDHPRVALACRRHMVGISYDAKKPSESPARLSVLDDDRAGVSHSNNVFSLLNDRPRFLAIAALITPTKGNVGRNLAERVNENIRNLSLFIMNEAASGKNGQQISQDIEDFFGIADDDSFEALIVRLRNEGAFDELEFGMDDFVAARNLFADVTGEILDCVDIVRESGIDLVTVPGNAINKRKIGIDKSSMIAYYDARQQLNGARTAKMIGIEGSETKKNLVLREYVRNRPDRFMTVTADMGKSAILKLSELTQTDIKAALDEGGGVIVIETPQGWNPEDWSLEHNPRKNVGAIAKFLEIKREKGAETFNAKSKKFGDDGTNSIIKFFKYGTRSMLSRYGKLNGKNKPWSIEDGIELRKKIAEAGSKDAAIPILAEALMRADERLGYIDTNDVFQKSDYWNRADLMLTEVDGVIYIRTLEQLATAFRNRISDEAMLSKDASTVLAELTSLEQVIGTPNDKMFNGDVAEMLLDEVRVASGVGSIAKIDRAIRPYSSSTERTYSLMYELFGKFDRNEVSNGSYVMPSRKEIESISNSMFLRLGKDVQEKIKGVAYPHDKFVNGEMVLDPNGSREHIYDYIGRPQDKEFMLIPGPQSLVYFDKDSDIGYLEKCNEYGITAAFSDVGLVPDKYIDDVVILEGIAILPFFDMRLNGSVADSIAPAPGQFFFQRNNVITSVEDTTYEIAPGDASGHATKECLDKVSFNLDGVEVFDAFDLFPNILRTRTGEFSDMPCKVEMPSKEEIRDWVLSGEGTVDYGVHEGNPKFAREVRRYNIRMREYADMFNSGMVDDHGMIVKGTDCHYDSIVGFVKLKIGPTDYVFAPIIPFHLEQQSKLFKQTKTTSKKPAKFSIEDFHADPEGPQFNMRWRFTGDIKGQYIKFFEGIGASNKLMVHANETAKSRTLANGIPIDMMYSTASIASRLFPVNKRIHTMITMLMVPRIDPAYAYNFADDSGSFPQNTMFMREGNPEPILVKDALASGSLTRAEWSRIVKDNPNMRYHRDDEINSIVKWMVEKCVKPGTGFQTVNPTMLLATRTNDGILDPVGTEFEAFMDSGYNFQNALMHFMNQMCPSLVPANIEDSCENTLFKPVKKDRTSDDYGVLQMMVPHWNADGVEYKKAENVYMSFGFFGEEFSGYKKVNFDAARRGIDDLNVSADLDGFDLSQVMSFARAGMSSVPSMNMMEPAQDKIMHDLPNDFDVVRYPLLATRIIDSNSWGKVISLTGHRPKDLWGYNDNANYKKVADELRRYCIENEVDTIISGMAQGFDQIGAQVAKDLDINLIAAVPFEGQENSWPSQRDRDRYQQLLDAADLIVYVNRKPSDKSDAAQKMDNRNHWMVNNSDLVFALWKQGKDHGGTWNCIKYARMKGKQIEYRDPDVISGKKAKDTLNPDFDGITHINVYSRGNTNLGRFLSNFARRPIDLPEGRFESIEGYWHYLGLPDGNQEKEILKSLSGAEAQRTGRELRSKYGTSNVGDFKEKIRNAIKVKLDTYRDEWENERLDLPLEHYYVGQNGTVSDQSGKFGWLTDILSEEIRKAK